MTVTTMSAMVTAALNMKLRSSVAILHELQIYWRRSAVFIGDYCEGKHHSNGQTIINQ